MQPIAHWWHSRLQGRMEKDNDSTTTPWVVVVVAVVVVVDAARTRVPQRGAGFGLSRCRLVEWRNENEEKEPQETYSAGPGYDETRRKRPVRTGSSSWRGSSSLIPPRPAHRSRTRRKTRPRCRGRGRCRCCHGRSSMVAVMLVLVRVKHGTSLVPTETGDPMAMVKKNKCHQSALCCLDHSPHRTSSCWLPFRRHCCRHPL